MDALKGRTVKAYYNENDPFAAIWLKNLMDRDIITPGDIDERSIEDVRADDLVGYTRCHFFAGAGGWDVALRIARWPEDRPVWTGSCPCQPFSSAGVRKGDADERHLWPAFYDLIEERRPPTVFGEQTAGGDGREWLSAVRYDLEQLGYACGCADLPAAGVGAYHIRQRIWFVAYSGRLQGWRGVEGQTEIVDREGRAGAPIFSGEDFGLGNSQIGRSRSHDGESGPGTQCEGEDRGSSISGGVADRDGERHPDILERGREGSIGDGKREGPRDRPEYGGTDGGTVGNPDKSGPQGWEEHPGEYARKFLTWETMQLILCTDGKLRPIPIEPEFFPLADGVPQRVGRLRTYGNAIIPMLAAKFIEAFAGE